MTCAKRARKPSLRRFRPGRRRATCIHEAGHAVARWYLGYPFERAWVRTIEEVFAGIAPKLNGVPATDAEGMVVGRSIGPDLDFCPEPLAKLPLEHRELVIRAQVARAEMGLVDFSAGIAAEARYRKCNTVAMMLVGGDDDVRSIERQLSSPWFLDPDARREARRLAGARARALIRSQQGWQAIQAIAAVLCERGELEWDEADQIIAGIFGHEMPYWGQCWPPSLEMIRAGKVPT